MPIIFNTLGLVILLLLLYLFQQKIVKYFSMVSFLLFGNGKVGVYFYFLFFLPGVILHELSHLFMASVLGVPTGNLTIFPRQEGKSWSLGKVSSAETDLLRGSLIGLAPMLIGSASLVGIVNLGLGVKDLNQVISLTFSLKTLGLFYLMLTFTNTMFLSPEDRTSIWAFPSLLLILFLLGRALGLAGILAAVGNFLLEITRPLILSFGLTVLVDFIFILPLVFLARLLLRFRE